MDEEGTLHENLGRKKQRRKIRSHGEKMKDLVALEEYLKKHLKQQEMKRWMQKD